MKNKTMKNKTIMIIIGCLLSSAAHAVDSLKLDQSLSTKINDTSVLKLQLELQEDKNFEGSINYIHIQSLLDFKTAYFNIAPGYRFVDKNTSQPIHIPMIEINKHIKISSLLYLKNRFRYMYEIHHNSDDTQILRYRFQPSVNILKNSSIAIGAELFTNEEINHKRTRYSTKLTHIINNWALSIGYEYNDNKNKANTDTITTDISYKF